MKWFVKVLNQYADFKGRAGREEYWMFFLINILATFAIGVIGFGIMMQTEKIGAAVLPLVYSMAVLIPSCAVTIRRLHDTGRKAWFSLVGLIPVIGGIWLLVVLISKGVPNENKYGKKPAKISSSHYYRRRSAAVALILSSALWLFSYLPIFYFSSGWEDSQIISTLLPVGLIFTGILFFSKRIFTKGIASSLIILSAVWLFRDVLEIREIYAYLFLDFNILLLISQFVFLIPVALFLSGFYILIKKTDRTVPACLLFAGSFIWIFNIIWELIQISIPLYDTSDILSLLNNTSAFLYLLSTTISIVVPVSLLVFARTLLSREKSVKDSKYVYDSKSNEPVSKKNRSEPDRRLDDNRTVVGIAQPETDRKTEPIIQSETGWDVKPVTVEEVNPYSRPEVGRKVDPTLQSETDREIDPITQQEASQKVEPTVQPETSRKVEPTAPPEDVQKVELIAPPEDSKKVEPIAPSRDVQKFEPIAPPETIRKVEISQTRLQPVVSENRRKVAFLREDKDDKNIWVVYKAPSKVDAMAFLSKIAVDKPSYYVVIETPEGNFGRDKDGIYQE